MTEAGSAAQAAYEAYSAEAGGKPLVSGAVLPAWDELPGEIRAAWLAAAIAAVTVATSAQTWNT